VSDVAVITGAASGFGRALAERCAARGMRVVLLDLDGDRAGAEAATLAAANGVEAFGLSVDVADGASVDEAAATVRERFGTAHLVISNVGVQLFASIDRATDDEWRWLLDVNVIGSARMARTFVPLLRRSSLGRLAFTTSSSVLDPASRLGAYQASKFAVWGLAETLRLELAGEGVEVSTIFPSGMITRHLETSQAAQPEALQRTIGEPDDFEAMVASNPGMTADVVAPEEAARRTIDGLLAGRPYLVTHGDLVDAVEVRQQALQQAAISARDDGA
jgi:NAD(P)-dependent dehydrogenase (short-subunit alcohol dehydrogenase family)